MTSGGNPVPFATVRPVELAAVFVRTDASGTASIDLLGGPRRLLVSRVGFRPETLDVVLGPRDTTLHVELERLEAEMDAILISATRTGRRVQDTPIRVELIDEEEVAEKVAMTPGDIAMMLNETAGLRVQPSNPAVGGATLRIQGLGGRHSLILADGLPLYGGQTGGLGLLQIPPVDLARVEVIKGSAAALYGSSALGGVVNLVSRRPGAEREQTLLLNQTSRNGTDGVYFGATPLGAAWGATLLGGYHRQGAVDLLSDGWTDVPGYRRAVLRPRLTFDDGEGHSAFLTAGYTAEGRRGGTMDNGTVADDDIIEALDTRRTDLGAHLRWRLGGVGSPALSFRGSAMQQDHDQRIDDIRERDEHRTLFAEGTLTVPRERLTFVAGAALEQTQYRNRDVPGFDEKRSTPGVFTQVDADLAAWLALSASARYDDLGDAGGFVNPRLSLLARRTTGAFAGWSLRASAGTGAFAPTARVEATEATGLIFVLPPAGLIAERATTGSIDLNGPIATPLGTLEVHASLFMGQVRSPLMAVDSTTVPFYGFPSLAVVNAIEPTRSGGAELLLRLTRPLGSGESAPLLRATLSYTLLRVTECDPASATTAGGCTRRLAPLTPRDAIGFVATHEREGRSRIGVEAYYTGRQQLHDDPFMTESRPYLIVGLLGERVITTRMGAARLFLNLENLGDVRQSRYAPLLRPSRGAGGRFSTDAWTELAGFTANGGIRFTF